MINQISLEDLRLAIIPFSDLGTDVPKVLESTTGSYLHYIREGLQTSLTIDHIGKITESFDGQTKVFASIESLLASERYANLRDWAQKQELMLRQEFPNQEKFLPLKGVLDGDIEQLDIAGLDAVLSREQPEGSTQVLLIDGPAGIGKTQFINQLALRRASNYSAKREPLLLHVESRGRQLSFIFDLIAFSLQRNRSSVTFDQIPILVKYGLIVLAIDGFDELADPSGYNLAWQQVNELVESVRGNGKLLLAGRETFIGRARVLKDLKVLREGIDPVHSFTLMPPEPVVAIKWLSESVGGEANLPDKFEQFLERGSLALRPFFLAKLADPELLSQIHAHGSGGVLNLLVNAMIAREAKKFTANIASQEQINKFAGFDLEKFVRDFMIEVARDMADSQSSSVSEAAISFISSVVMPSGIDETTEYMLRNRAAYIGFLTKDSRAGYLQFYHDKFYEYFLSEAIFESIRSLEIPKFVRKNIFGASFLETYSGVIEVKYSENCGFDYFANLSNLIHESRGLDRGRKNLSSVALSSLSFYEGAEFVIQDAEIDEARIVGTAGSALLRNCLISQLDVRGSDISKIYSDGTTIITLVASTESLFPDYGFYPQRLVVVSGGAETELYSSAEVADWVKRHSVNPPEEDHGLVPADLRDHPVFKVLARAARIKRYWLRAADDVIAEKILNDENWPLIERTLEENDLLTIEVRPAAGPNPRFIHVRTPLEILSEDKSNPNVVRLYSDLVSKVRDL